MQLKITIEVCDGSTTNASEIACIERAELTNVSCGLSMSEAKLILANVQQALVTAQVEAHLSAQDHCSNCGGALSHKDNHTIVLRTLFGKLRLSSPRFRTCPCQQNLGGKKSHSPLALVLPERTSPELCYLQCKWSALMSYGMSGQLLADVLPFEKPLNPAVLSRQVAHSAERSDSELGPARIVYMETDQRKLAALPTPAARFTVGIDGGWVHGREGKKRKAGSFELIVGKSMAPEGSVRRFGFVNGYDIKPQSRLYEMLCAQGLAANQPVTFLSDGGDTVRGLQMFLSPKSDHLLDWWHVAMRLRLLCQLAKNIPTQPQQNNAKEQDKITAEQLISQLERVKWNLWHGNALRAMAVLEDIQANLAEVVTEPHAEQKLYKAVKNFRGYIEANEEFVADYGELYRRGETISTAFVESTVNELISRRMVKKQQMRWTKAGAHRLLQLRVQVLDGELRRNFERWYPGLRIEEALTSAAA